jgi:hypothetical protein
MATDLELAVTTLLLKSPKYDKYWSYFDGDQPLVYSRERLREIFKNLDANFNENWCAVVIESLTDKIQLQRITIADNEVATKRLDDIMKASELASESSEVHLAVAVTGESYVIAWKDGVEDEEGNVVGGEPEFYYNDPRLCHMFYESAHPRVKRMACKMWLGDDGYRYLTLYYPDRLEYYRTSNPVVTDLTVAETIGDIGSYWKSFEVYGSDANNPYGEIPVFHFYRTRRKCTGELKNIIPIQDGVNKLVSDMMVSAEFGAFPQRWVISQGDPGQLQNAPNKVWQFPAADEEGQPVSVGQFPATQLSNFLDAIEKKTTTIGIISRTPKHYFFTQGGDPSGESLIAMESPLNRKAQKYIDTLTSPWSELGRFLLKLDGLDVEKNAIIPHFDKPETVQPYTASLIRKENTQAGIPLITQLRWEGYTEEEIAQLEADQKAAQAAERASLAQAMVDQQRNFDQGGNQGE